MVSIKAILAFALAGAAIATPIENRNNHVKCNNKALKGHEQKLSVENVQRQLGAAPIDTGKSGYPHDFENFQNIKFPKGCRNERLREYPVFQAEGARYNFDSRPKDNPGPFRVIATAETRLYCGVISHDGENDNPNAGNFHLCE
ncbi:hypothetical protein FQN49_001567 [Arthroderma sp. PD_2]|nr:hypothetical protein FQN49_001567 [Arthroderma sp. PD_2]